jgi:hypothetical protein
MNIPADKIAHFKAGCLIAAAAFLAGLIGVGLSMYVQGLTVYDLARPLVFNIAGLVAAVAGAVAGLTKEYADRADNQIYPGMHGVEVLDAVATAAPGVLLWVASFVYLALNLSV